LADLDAQSAKLIEIIDNLAPDFIFLTGDYVPHEKNVSDLD